MRKYISIAGCSLLALALAESAWADNVATRWVERALSAVRTANTSTPRAGRVYAMTTIAMYDAVNGIDRAGGSSTWGHALVPADGAPPAGDPRAAATAAAHAVLIALFPTQQMALDAARDAELAALSDADPASISQGRDWGEYVGDQVVFLRSNDGIQVPETQPAGTGPGVFPRPFANAQFRNMAPFGVASIDPYASPGPPPLSSGQYAIDLNEVKALGDINDTDPERAAVAKHWVAETNTARETGLWLKVALNVVEDQGTVDSLSDTARLFALLGMSIADAVTTSWTAKFNYHFWRPGDAIRNASTDGNPGTDEDATWNPRNGVNNFGGTPEHTSGTSTFAGAASTVLAGFYCHDDVAFSFASELGTVRFYRGFKEAAREAGRSRIYGGIHFEFSNVLGREAGKGIGKEILRTRLVPAGPCHGATCVCSG